MATAPAAPKVAGNIDVIDHDRERSFARRTLLHLRDQAQAGPPQRGDEVARGGAGRGEMEQERLGLRSLLHRQVLLRLPHDALQHRVFRLRHTRCGVMRLGPQVTRFTHGPFLLISGILIAG